MNIFKRDSSLHNFQWENLGDIKEGRGDLGEDMPVLVYRLMQYTMLDVLTKDFGADKANEYFVRAGHLAGEDSPETSWIPRWISILFLQIFKRHSWISGSESCAWKHSIPIRETSFLR